MSGMRDWSEMMIKVDSFLLIVLVLAYPNEGVVAVSTLTLVLSICCNHTSLPTKRSYKVGY